MGTLWGQVQKSPKIGQKMSENRSDKGPKIVLNPGGLKIPICPGGLKIPICPGTWHMAHGTWYMAHGTWHMAHGTWHMAHAGFLPKGARDGGGDGDA